MGDASAEIVRVTTLRAFVYLTQQNALTENNLRVGAGRLFSASWGLYPDRVEALASGHVHWRPDRTADPAHGGFMSPFAGTRLASSSGIQLESDAERIRFERYPERPSRLSGLFVFPDRSTAETVNKVHGWNLDELTEVSVTALRLAAQDMEIASLAHSMYAAGPVTPLMADRLWDAYWAGWTVNDLDLAPQRTPIPEFLIDGWIEVAPAL